MQDIYPTYYSRFSCLAGHCPDTCCDQWEVVVDEDTAALYAAVPGDLGDRLRSALTYDEDGDLILGYENGRCPLYERETGLCSVQKALGHQALCKTCREFPRICQDYTAFREHSLSFACPEAARLGLFGADFPALIATGEPDPWPEDYDAGDMAFLQKVRNAMFSFLKDTAYSISQRIALCLGLAEATQAQMDGEPPAPFSPEEALARFSAAWADGPWEEAFRFYRSLDILSPRWAALLDRAPEKAPSFDPFLTYPQEFGNLMFDGLYRTLLCSVSDFDLLIRVKAAALSCALARYLIAREPDSQDSRLEIYHLYAREITHCAENQDALLDACYSEGYFQTESIFSLLR